MKSHKWTKLSNSEVNREHFIEKFARNKRLIKEREQEEKSTRGGGADRVAEGYFVDKMAKGTQYSMSGLIVPLF